MSLQRERRCNQLQLQPGISTSQIIRFQIFVHLRGGGGGEQGGGSEDKVDPQASGGAEGACGRFLLIDSELIDLRFPP